MKTADLKFNQLCEEIDIWKEEARYWKAKYEKLEQESNEKLNSDLGTMKNMTGSILTALLHS